MHQLALVAEVLTLLAACSEHLGKLAQTVSRLSSVATVSHRLEFRDYRSGPLLEGFVDAEFLGGTARSLWLELNWTPGEWILESSVLVVGHDGRQEAIREFPSEEVASFQELEAKLMNTIARLEQASIEFADLGPQELQPPE